MSRVRIVGCGAMGSAIAKIFAKQGVELVLYDHDHEKAQTLAKQISASVCRFPLENHTSQEILLLCFKPQDLISSAAELKSFQGKLVVSILAGITSEQLKQLFPTQRVLRMILSLAAQYGKAVVGLAKDPSLDTMRAEIERLFAPLGQLRWIAQTACDALTALTGSGPAFVCALIEAMVDAAIAMGFSAEDGYDLTMHMIDGVLTTLEQSNTLPTQLKWKICSPSGSTIAGLRIFESQAVRSGIIETFVAAHKRAQELGRQ